MFADRPSVCRRTCGKGRVSATWASTLSLLGSPWPFALHTAISTPLRKLAKEVDGLPGTEYSRSAFPSQCHRSDLLLRSSASSVCVKLPMFLWMQEGEHAPYVVHGMTRPESTVAATPQKRDASIIAQTVSRSIIFKKVAIDGSARLLQKDSRPDVYNGRFKHQVQTYVVLKL